MEAKDLPPTFIGSFAHYYRLLTLGHTGLVPETEIEPVTDLVSAAEVGGHFTLEPCPSEQARLELFLNLDLHVVAFAQRSGGLLVLRAHQPAQRLCLLRERLTLLAYAAAQCFERRHDGIAAAARSHRVVLEREAVEAQRERGGALTPQRVA